MASRKKIKIVEVAETVAAQESMPVPEPIHEPVPLKLTREEILEMAFLEQQVRHGNALTELETLKRDALLAQIDPSSRIKLFDTKIKASTTMVTNARDQWIQARALISKRLGGIDLDQYAYDDQTGTLQKPDQ